MNIFGTALVAAVGIAIPSMVAAIPLNFSIFENADGADVSEVNLWVDVIDGGSYLDLVIHNDSTVESFVRKLYFETPTSAVGSLTNGRIQEEGEGVNFRDASSSRRPPGSIGDWAGTLYHTRAHNPGPRHGINPGEFLTVRFDHAGSGDVMRMFTDPDVRIAAHIQGLGENGQYSVWGRTGDPGDPVPLPATVWLFGSGLASMLGGRAIRRRKRA